MAITAQLNLDTAEECAKQVLSENDSPVIWLVGTANASEGGSWNDTVSTAISLDEAKLLIADLSVTVAKVEIAIYNERNQSKEE